MCGGMLFPFAEAQVVQRGMVLEMNSGNRPLAGVEIRATGAAPSDSDQEGQFVLSFNFLFPFLFSWVRYRKKRKSALMKHYRYPKKIKIISAIFFLLVPIVICGLEIWIYGKQGWINIVY